MRDEKSSSCRSSVPNFIINEAHYSWRDGSISERTDDILKHRLFEKYPNAKRYLQDVLDLKELWVLAYRNSIPIRGNNTNNYVEGQFLIIKDEILNRIKNTIFYDL